MVYQGISDGYEGTLSSAQKESFFKKGYLVVDEVFNPEVDFALLLDEYSALLDELAGEMLVHGDISEYDNAASFQQRVVDIVRQSGGFPIQAFDISYPQSGIRPETPIFLGEGAFRLIMHDRLLDVVQSLIGPEITVAPIQHIRLKIPLKMASGEQIKGDGTPQVGGTTPRHQDIGVQVADADSARVLTVWAPVTDATEEMGCLALWPGSHTEGVLKHCPSPGGLYIPGTEINNRDSVSIPMEAGSILLMDRHMPHRALPNRSGFVRWSFDLRYQPTGDPNGRPQFPEIVARSDISPEKEVRDYREWAKAWINARDELCAGSGATELQYNRWQLDAPWCA